MGLPRLQTCCFVLDLKTGNILLGCLNAVLSFIMMVVMIVAAVMVGSMAENEGRELSEAESEDSPLAPVLVDEQAELSGFYAMTVILAIMFFAKFAFDVFFVYGVIKERAGIIKAYLIMWLVFFLLSVFTFSVNVMRYGAGTIFTEICYIGLNVYAILLSHSFYKQLNEREEV